MPVTDIQHDVDALTLTITAEFAADLSGHLGRHDLTPGARTTYVMTSPEGEEYHGCWTITGVAAPGGFALDAGFTPDPDLPVSRNDYTFTAVAGGTRATYIGTYACAESLQQVLDMGVVGFPDGGAHPHARWPPRRRLRRGGLRDQRHHAPGLRRRALTVNTLV